MEFVSFVASQVWMQAQQSRAEEAEDARNDQGDLQYYSSVREKRDQAALIRLLPRGQWENGTRVIVMARCGIVHIGTSASRRHATCGHSSSILATTA